MHPNVNEAMGVKAIETIGVLKTECQDNWVSENVPFTLLVRLFKWPFNMGKGKIIVLLSKWQGPASYY